LLRKDTFRNKKQLQTKIGGKLYLVINICEGELVAEIKKK